MLDVSAKNIAFCFSRPSNKRSITTEQQLFEIMGSPKTMKTPDRKDDPSLPAELVQTAEWTKWRGYDYKDIETRLIDFGEFFTRQ